MAPIANLLLYPLRLPRNHRKNCTTAWRILKSFLKASVGDISFFSFQRPTELPNYYIFKVYCLLFTYLGTYPPGPLWWVFYQILSLSIVKLSIKRNTQLLVLTLLNKSWVFLQILNLTILKLSIWKILNLSGPGGQVLNQLFSSSTKIKVRILLEW